MGCILIIAGENSGEKHGASLVRQFKKIDPSFTFFGIGGRHMASQGVRLLYTVKDLALVGFFEILAHLPRLRKIFTHLIRETKRLKPSAAVLIDSPDFNLRLARRLESLSIPVLYYISPTVWAWRPRRIHIIRKTVAKMLLIFPFEEKIYKEHGIPATYVGHPLKERVKFSMSREDFLKKYGIHPEKIRVTVLPGSRRSEIKNHLPILIQAMARIKKDYDVQFILPLAENLEEEYVASFIPSTLDSLKIIKRDVYEALSYSDIALSSCGTANLEAALLGTPLITFYRISPLTYYSGIKLIKIKNFSIVNILAGQRIIPELIQKEFTAGNIYGEFKKILQSKSLQEKMKAHYKEIDSLLGEKIASENAARELRWLIQSKVETLKKEA